MTPKFERDLRRALPVVLVVLFFVGMAFIYWKIAYGGGLHIPPIREVLSPAKQVVEPLPDPKPELEWVRVTGNHVLFFPVVKGQCVHRSALMHVHKGYKALVISRQGEFVEVELDNQEALHTHGCIHHTLLEPDNG